ncbi:MAG: hypothetical protein WC770_03905 [Phycisphaerae bacterium]|jgi:hypothetical protein
MFRLFKAKQSDKVDADRHYDEDDHANIPDAILNDGGIAEVTNVIYKFFASMHMQLSRQNRLLSKTLKARDENLAALENCFCTVADCQKQTAELANQFIERHALHPAILTVDLLSNLISQIARQADTLINSQDISPSLATLMPLILDAAKIADFKKAQLEIQTVSPVDGDDLDNSLHEIVKAIATDDESKNKKTHDTITAGVVYRGKILRPAKISVYRFSGNVAADKNSKD